MKQQVSRSIGIFDPSGKNNNPLTGEKYTSSYPTLAKKWSALSAYDRRDEIMEMISQNQVIIVQSETGSGKTVLLPKFALHYTDYQGKVVVTIPKRRIVQSSAEYAAVTLDVTLGEQVGYRYMGKVQSGENTVLEYTTDGSLLARLSREGDLADCKVVIIDEAHERKITIDFLLLHLRKLIRTTRPDLKLIIMSATIDLEKYTTYFSDLQCASISLSGVTNFPVEMIYLPDKITGFKDVTKKVDHILRKNKEKNIMAFVNSGAAAKKNCGLLLMKHPRSLCVEMYSGMPDEDKEMATEPGKYKTAGYQQKVVYSTNIGESSLTIPDLDVVVDNGMELTSKYIPHLYAYSLLPCEITKAQATQRAGRVGRTGPGTCYRMYSESTYQNMLSYPEPETLRGDLTTKLLALTLPNRTLGEAHETIMQLLDPPSEAQIKSAVNLLTLYQLIGISDSDTDSKVTDNQSKKITELGRAILQHDRYPLHHLLFLVYANSLGIRKYACCLVAMLFVSRKKQGIFFEDPDVNLLQKTSTKLQSDHLALLHLLFRYLKGEKDSLKKEGFRIDSLELAAEKAKEIAKSIRRSPFPIIESLSEKILADQDVTSQDIKMKVKTALWYSHFHRQMIDGKIKVSRKKLQVTPSKSSFLSKIPKTGLIVYDTLMAKRDGGWEIGGNTLIDGKVDIIR